MISSSAYAHIFMTPTRTAVRRAARRGGGVVGEAKAGALATPAAHAARAARAARAALIAAALTAVAAVAAAAAVAVIAQA